MLRFLAFFPSYIHFTLDVQICSLRPGVWSLLSVIQAGLHSSRPSNACMQCVAMIHIRNAWCAAGLGRLRKTLSVYGVIGTGRECSLTIVVNKMLYDMILYV